jgi:HAD superfamily hydrolase (TIGR01509 family)
MADDASQPARAPRPAAVRHLRGVIFDMDGVVVDSEPLSLRTIAQVVTDRGGVADPATFTGLIGLSLDEALTIAAERSGRDLDAGVLRGAYDELYLPRLRATATPTPGLSELTGALSVAGVPMALASSSRLAEIEAVVAALRLGPVLSVIASAEEVARPKPAPDVYLLAVERLGVGAAGVVAIEDSASGVAAAKAAGLRCVAVRTALTRRHDHGGAALTVTSLTELGPDVLGCVAASGPGDIGHS